MTPEVDKNMLRGRYSLVDVACLPLVLNEGGSPPMRDRNLEERLYRHIKYVPPATYK